MGKQNEIGLGALKMIGHLHCADRSSALTNYCKYLNLRNMKVTCRSDRNFRV